MTNEEKEILIGSIKTANTHWDYAEIGYLEGLVHGLNLRRGENEKISLVNGMQLYEGGKLIYRFGDDDE